MNTACPETGNLRANTSADWAGACTPAEAPEAIQPARDRYIVPTPGKVYWDGVINALKIDLSNPKRAPLLLIAGEIDLIADASMVRAIYDKQRPAPPPTEYKMFAGRSHWTGIDPGLEQVADYALEWAVINTRSSETAAVAEVMAA